jgi:hypothetical protein
LNLGIVSIIASPPSAAPSLRAPTSRCLPVHAHRAPFWPSRPPESWSNLQKQHQFHIVQTNLRSEVAPCIASASHQIDSPQNFAHFLDEWDWRCNALPVFGIHRDINSRRESTRLFEWSTLRRNRPRNCPKIARGQAPSSFCSNRNQ